MKVKDLILALQSFDPDTDVVIPVTDITRKVFEWPVHGVRTSHELDSNRVCIISYVLEG